MSKLNMFWIVFKPRPASELCDIISPVTVSELLRMGRDLVHTWEIHSAWTELSEAQEVAREILGLNKEIIEEEV